MTYYIGGDKLWWCVVFFLYSAISFLLYIFISNNAEAGIYILPGVMYFIVTLAVLIWQNSNHHWVGIK